MEKHPKQDFQVERLAFFSDAVFAIVITLLIIEFKIPTVTKDSTLASVWEQIYHLKSHLFALLITFMLIVVYWSRHHLLFKHIHNYNKQIVIANMVTLLPIIFFPFTTAFVAESIVNEEIMPLAFRFYLLNHLAAALATFALYWLAFVKYPDMSYEMTPEEKFKFYSDTLYSTIMFLIILIVMSFTSNMITIVSVTLFLAFFKKIIEMFLKKRLA